LLTSRVHAGRSEKPASPFDRPPLSVKETGRAEAQLLISPHRREARHDPAFQEVCVPLYAPAPGEHRHALTADDARDEDTVVDASGITIGGDDVDDDFY
jgi:hypothetical protein